MDIYGYQAYQYNQSDELANQMLSQQPLSSSVPFGRPASEPHYMPAPSGSPWNVQSIPWGLTSPPQLVQFTGQNQGLLPKISTVPHCKRKSLDVEPPIPAKQLITEEKMAAHLNGLHISTEYTSHSLASEDMMDVGMDSPVPSTSTANIPMSERLKGHTIVLSDEVKKIKTEPIIPASLMERLEKPSMSLVVWKPKENIILEKIKEEEKRKPGESKPRKGVLLTQDDNVPIDDVEM